MANKNRKRGRRGNHEGSIVLRKDGLYQASIMFNGIKKYSYSMDKRVCQTWLAEQQLRLSRNQPVTDNNITLLKWLQHYIETYCEGYCRPATIDNYRLYADKHIARSIIADTPISKLTCDHIQLFLNNLERLDGNGELSSKSIRNMYIFLKAALKQAKVCGLTYINAAEGVRLKKGESNKRPLLSDEQVNAVIQAAGSHAFSIGIKIQATVGLRTSEVLALRHSSLITVDGIPALNVEYAVKREPVKNPKAGSPMTYWVLSEPKTTASKALVPIPCSLYKEIQDSINAQHEQAAKCPVYIDDPFICGDPDTGGLVTPDRYRAFWNKLREQVGLPKEAVLHCLRHYAASTLIKNGASPVATARILRHAQNSTTIPVPNSNTKPTQYLPTIILISKGRFSCLYASNLPHCFFRNLIQFTSAKFTILLPCFSA